jgi:hypothetical protein
MTGGVRIHRRKDDDGGFAQIPNDTLRDPRLGWAARGLLAEILSRPDGWSTSADRIYAQRRRVPGGRGEGIRRIRTALRELEACGYMRRVVVRGPRGRIATELHFYDVPAGRTDYTVTDSRWSSTPVTDASVTDRSVRVQSLITPNKNTQTNTDHEHAFSLGAELPPIDGLADNERDTFAAWIAETHRARAPRSFLRGISKGDYPELLAKYRTDTSNDQPARPSWCGDSECDERTRLRVNADGNPYRCPKCHPLSAVHGMLESS